MFLSSGDEYVGNFLSCLNGVKCPFEPQEGRWNFSQDAAAEKGPHLTLMGESPGFSRVQVGSLGFLSSCDGDLTDPLVLPQESEVSIPVARGLSGFLSSWCKGIGPHLVLRMEPQGSSPVLTWISWFLWSFNRGVRLRLVWRHGAPLLSRCVKGVSGFLSCWRRDMGLFLEVPQGFHTSLHVWSQYSWSQLSQCRVMRLVWSGWGNWGLFKMRYNSRGCAWVSR